MPKPLRLALHARLAATLTLCLLLGLMGQWGLMAHHMVEEANARALMAQRSFVQLYAPRLAELERSGHGEAITMVLQQGLHAQNLVGRAVWRKPSSQGVELASPHLAEQAPQWVLDLIAPEGSGSLQGVTSNGASRNGSSHAAQLKVWPHRALLAAELWRSWRAQWLINAGILLAWALILLFLLRYKLQGLSAIARASTQLLSQPDIRVPVKGSPEVQRLAKAFNAMAGVMQKTRAAAKAKVEQSTWTVNHDALTALPNRTLLMDRLSQALTQCNRQHEGIALGLINLDHFKALNERLGHSAGDEVLKLVAQRLSDQMRQGDTLARVGSDDFALLLTNLRQVSDAQAVFERVLVLIEQPFHLAGTEIRLTASAGLALQEPVDHSTGATVLEADQLIRQADQMMALAKQSGRHQLKVWQADQISANSIEQQWADRLVAGIHNGELVLHFQPKVDLRSGKLVGLEALVRWQHPSRGLLMPGAFLPYVENTTAIVDVGRWTLRQAMQHMRQWRAQGHFWPVSVNVPARQFSSSDFVDELRGLLAQFPDIEPQHLTVEILETSSMEDLNQVRQTVETVQALGVHCSLDDFGTGYSSLTYLKQLPAHEIKIDQSFVRGMLDDNGDLALVEGIITLAKVFSRKLVAEGVETLEHGALLYRLGCRVMQGWAISKPIPADDVPAWEQQYQSPRLWQDWSAHRWNLNHFPVLVAGYDIRAWLNALKQALDGDTHALGTDAKQNYLRSRLGAWYQRLGERQFGHIEAVEALDNLHQRMHSRAALLLQAFVQGEPEQAQSEWQVLRDEAGALMDAMTTLHQLVLKDDSEVTTRF
jgi:diguanylate cyclase (GGDEF)-like protein